MASGHLPPLPAAGRRRTAGTSARGVDRLSWWALLLPALAFAALLVVSGSGGHGGTGAPPYGGLVAHLRTVLPHPPAER